jgi:hypothetical protein
MPIEGIYGCRRGYADEEKVVIKKKRIAFCVISLSCDALREREKKIGTLCCNDINQ